MPPAGILRVESAGSIWEIDLTLNRYRRMPREEQPRERPEWGGPDAGPLQDFVWHEMRDKPFVIRSTSKFLPDRLVIPTPLKDGKDCVTAPLSVTESTHVRSVIESEP